LSPGQGALPQVMVNSARQGDVLVLTTLKKQTKDIRDKDSLALDPSFVSGVAVVSQRPLMGTHVSVFSAQDTWVVDENRAMKTAARRKLPSTNPAQTASAARTRVGGLAPSALAGKERGERLTEPATDFTDRRDRGCPSSG
jgi:hypothetical protein